MATTAEVQHIVIDHLSATDQARMLVYARALAQPQGFPHTPLALGTPGSAIANLRVSSEGGEEMEQALVDCENIPSLTSH